MKKQSILFVCMGNICRSPTAEAVVRRAVKERGLADSITLDSAGTDAYHVGQTPDPRAQQAARGRGYDLSGIRARRISPQDFERFDLILAMDRAVLASLRRACPAEHSDRVALFMNYAEQYQEDDVPDPYYGGREGFEHVLDLIESACDGLILAVKTRVAVR